MNGRTLLWGGTAVVLWGGIIVVVVGLAATYFYEWNHKAAPPPPRATAPSAPAKPEPAIHHPVPGASEQTQTPATALPTLSDSDAAIVGALTQFFGKSAAARFLVPTNVVRNIVVTVDNLPRQKVAVERRPVKPTPGQTLADGDADAGETVTLNVRNFARYAPFVSAVQATDSKQLAALYFHWYPLFQEAYEGLGYPGHYFNDRLVEAIDDLLATPEIKGPIRLVRPKVFYEYADPTLEARSAGQKLLIRMGPDNAAQIKSKLRELRVEVIGQAHPG
jgi:hypothetical protein